MITAPISTPKRLSRKAVSKLSIGLHGYFVNKFQTYGKIVRLNNLIKQDI